MHSHKSIPQPHPGREIQFAHNRRPRGSAFLPPANFRNPYGMSFAVVPFSAATPALDDIGILKRVSTPCIQPFQRAVQVLELAFELGLESLFKQGAKGFARRHPARD